MSDALITIDFAEGRAVFRGVRPDGGAKWAWYDRLPDGSMTGNKMPRRIRNYTKHRSTHDSQDAAEA